MKVLLFLKAIAIQAWWRGVLARRRAKRRRQAADTIRRYDPHKTDQQEAPSTS